MPTVPFMVRLPLNVSVVKALFSDKVLPVLKVILFGRVILLARANIPLTVTLDVFCRALEFPTNKVAPLLTVVAPLYVFAPVRETVPGVLPIVRLLPLEPAIMPA